MKKGNDRDFTAMERRNFLKRTGIAGLGIAAGGLLVGGGARALASERLTSAIGRGDSYGENNVKVDTA
ncbi:MAG TPA: twin-arginine translocation signal domain-containing protein [Candidatus Acidoferrales bacterium]